MKKRKPTDLIFKLDHQFVLYLQRCKVTAADLPPDQYREMRRAFFGGLGQMFFLVTQDVIDITNQRDQGTTLSLLQKQLEDFWEMELQAHDLGLSPMHPTMLVKCDCGWQGQLQELVKPAADGGLATCPSCGEDHLYFKR